MKALPLQALIAAVAILPATCLTANELTEILVTAEFRPIALQDQASSISVVTGEDIQQRAAQHLEEVLNIAPNVNFSSGSSRARYYQIRGIGERSQFQEPLNPSIGFVIDNIDFSGLGTIGTLFDVDQVEVLRGPQGTLHGANALAGLINIRTGQPQNEPALRVEATAAQYNSLNLGVVGTGPLVTDKLLYRLAINNYQSDGFIENDYLDREDTNNRNETSVRGKLRWLVNEIHTLDITAIYVDVENGYDAFSLDNTRHTLSDQPGQDEQKSKALALNWHGEARSIDLEATFTYANSETDYGFDEDWSFVGIAPGWEYSSFDQYLRDRDSFSAQLRFLSNEQSSLFSGSTDWVIGAYFLHNEEALRRRYTYLEQDFLSDYDTGTLALFGQFDSQLSERWRASSGLRVEQRRTDYRDSNGVDSDPENNLWGGKLVFEYSPSDDTMMYAGVSRGYRANGVNANILASMDSTDDPGILEQLHAVQEFDEEFLINYEAGIKSSFAANTVRTRLAFFYMDRKDQQVRGSLVVAREDGSTAFIDYTNNAARGNNYGAELELDWLVSERLNVYANIGLLQTEFDEYINANGDDLSGRDQAQAPAYQYALGGRFEFGRGFYGRLDLEGKDDYYFSDRHQVKAPSYDLLHARLGYQTQDWSAALWVRNVTDEEVTVRGFGSFGNDPRKEYALEPYYQYGDPRVAGISASYSF
ncbi:MAG: TonB-dependent receptor [Proteobacteria bacterium]|nr:TonB-dependent receptor [Pseudomonadota bacterium]